MEITKIEKEQGEGTTPAGAPASKDASKNTAAKSGKPEMAREKSPSAKEAEGNKKPKGEKDPKTPKEATISTKTIISIDNTPEEVIELANQGVDLYFADEKDRFLELPSAAVESLDFYNRQRYFTARNIMHGNLDLSAADGRKYKPQPGRATAAQQMSVYGKDPRFHYCWKRPDELRQAAREGYVIAGDPTLDTFYGDAGSSHTVGLQGQEEMVLTKIPKEEFEASKAQAVKKSKDRRASVESNAIADILKGGGVPHKDKEE